MIKLFSLKQQTKAGANPQSTKKTSAAYLRVQKGMYNQSVPHPVDLMLTYKFIP